MTNYKIARRLVEMRKRQEAVRDRIGMIATLSFAMVITSFLLMG